MSSPLKKFENRPKKAEIKSIPEIYEYRRPPLIRQKSLSVIRPKSQLQMTLHYTHPKLRNRLKNLSMRPLF